MYTYVNMNIVMLILNVVICIMLHIQTAQLLLSTDYNIRLILMFSIRNMYFYDITIALYVHRAVKVQCTIIVSALW